MIQISSLIPALNSLVREDPFYEVAVQAAGISGQSGWQAFLLQQARLLQQRTNAVLGLSGTIEVGGEQVLAELRVVGDSLYGVYGRDG